MTDGLLQQKLRATLAECASHQQRMAYAYGHIKAFLPADAERVDALSEDQVAALDQYLYRFTKLQDAMGGRLFRQSLELLGEDSRALAYIDKLNRLEQLGALRSAVEWLALRELRNMLAHEYADDREALADGINIAFKKYVEIGQILEQFERYIYRYL